MSNKVPRKAVAATAGPALMRAAVPRIVRTVSAGRHPAGVKQVFPAATAGAFRVLTGLGSPCDRVVPNPGKQASIKLQFTVLMTTQPKGNPY